MKQTFEEKVRAMTPKEHIMNMVEALRQPMVNVDMSTFGDENGGVCFGCAATNAVCRINDIAFPPTHIYGRKAQSDFIGADIEFLRNYENAIDELRGGYLERCDYWFGQIELPAIKKKPGLYLPELDDDYTEADLLPYVELAEYQDQ